MTNLASLLPGLAPFVLLPLLPSGELPRQLPANPTAGPELFTQTFSDQFGPEIANWNGEQLLIPKFTNPRDSTLREVRVEMCGETFAEATFQNLDDEPCVYVYEVFSDIQLSCADPDIPMGEFALDLTVAGGPIPLAPGELGMDAGGTGSVCNPVEVVEDKTLLQHFIAGPGDEMLVFDSSGFTGSATQGCGGIDFYCLVESSVSVTVTYTFELPPDLPPLCLFGCDPLMICENGITLILLDARRSEDPEGEPLAYAWTTDCPNAVIDDPSARTTLLTIDTGSGPCELTCEVTLAVSDGVNVSECGDTIDL